MAWVADQGDRRHAQYGSTAQTPWATPLVWPQSVWYAGLVIFALVAAGYAIRATLVLVSGPIDTLNHDFHPKSAKEELKEELDDLAQRLVGRRSATMSLAISGSHSSPCSA